MAVNPISSWIFDITSTPRGITLWTKAGGHVDAITREFRPPFYCTLTDETAHWEMVDALTEKYGAYPCTFQTIYGEERGYCIHASRDVAEEIERQTQFSASLYNVDLQKSQLYCAAKGCLPCSTGTQSPFSAETTHPLTTITIRPAGRPETTRTLTDVQVTGRRSHLLRGSEPSVVHDLFTVITDEDPDLMLFHSIDRWADRILAASEKAGIPCALSRTGRYRRLREMSYTSYGQMRHRPPALIPEGRVLIDTDASFMYRTGGLAGVFLASRLTGIPPNLTSRFTPGTIISSYECSEALKRGIAIPFRKNDAEATRNCRDVRLDDRGGLILQPVPGLYGAASQIDFTSFYPSIIVNYNISPETLADPEKDGFLPAVIDPLLKFRIKMKAKKREDPHYAGMDAVLKWMLVTCFGYTGYKNARFGRIEMHEKITAISADILGSVKRMAEEMGYTVLHGIVDCLWVQGGDGTDLKKRIEEVTAIPTEQEDYDWLVFLPQKDGSGSYTNYFGRLADGTMKLRGVAAQRRDTPPYVCAMQEACFSLMAEAASPDELAGYEEPVTALYRSYRDSMTDAPASSFVIHRRLSKTAYQNNSISAAVVRMYRAEGVPPEPGMDVEYLVQDARTKTVVPGWRAKNPDYSYYAALLEKAWREVYFPFQWINKHA
ncbi:type B DNA-directed DNA polymerase [Methanogenium organophilum]|uniref:DNA-directed DNA polymerase n=1 Tax=Methanogenium organophilum TaxID=2199 RepID=A0A9X9T7Z1_METOG|nr:type B DNA-directed DNA polymerase [Methanogenium organophilum]WAI00911.1 type B DNA-directed DNA polymerase [Methanogenium organophilum]